MFLRGRRLHFAFYSIGVIYIPSNNTPWFQVLRVLGISCHSLVPSVCQIYLLSKPPITQVLRLCWTLSFLWSVGRIQETPLEFLSPMMERIKNRTLGKKRVSLMGPEASVYVAWLMWLLGCGKAWNYVGTTQWLRAIYLMLDRKKGEAMEGDRPKTKEVLQEHAPSDQLSQLGPISQEINSVTKPEACSMASHLMLLWGSSIQTLILQEHFISKVP